MSVGDLRGNIGLLERCLKHLKYPAAVDEVGLTLGDPLGALPILHFALLKYSRHVAAYVMAKGIQLHGKTDEGFVKGAFRLFRDHLGLKVVLTPAQFLEQGFAERKVLLLVDVVKAVRQIHLAGVKQERTKLNNACRQSPAQQLAASCSPPPAPRVLRGSSQAASQQQQQLRRVPVTAATDASQDIYEVLPSGGLDWRAVAASPAGSRVADDLVKLILSPRSAKKAKSSTSPAAVANTASDAHASSDQQQRRHAVQQSRQQGQFDAVGAINSYMLSQPQGLQHSPMCSQQQQQHYWDQVGSPSSSRHDAAAWQDQLIAAGLLPLPRQQQQPTAPISTAAADGRYEGGSLAAGWGTAEAVLQQQQSQQHEHKTCRQDLLQHMQQESQQQQDQEPEQRRPLRSCLWPPSKAGQQASSSNGTGKMAGAPALPGEAPAAADAAAVHAGGCCEPGMNTASHVCQPQLAMALPAAQTAVAAVASAAGTVSGLQQQLAAALQAMSELQQRLGQAEEHMLQQRSAAVKFEEAANARITLLEGRLKFLENQINSQQQQQQQQQRPGPAAAASPAWSSSDAANTAGGLGSSRGRGSAAALAAMALRGSKSYLPADHFSRLAGASHQTSPATIHHTTAPPRRSPACSAAAGTDYVDWRSAASAAAAAVATGLAASPLSSPVRGMGQGPAAAAERSPGHNSWVSRARELGLEDRTDAADAPTLDDDGGGGDEFASAVHAEQAQAAAFRADSALQRSYDLLNVKALEQQGNAGAGGLHAEGSSIGSLRGGSGGAPGRGAGSASGTGLLIDKLAHRAVEAQKLLESFRGK